MGAFDNLFHSCFRINGFHQRNYSSHVLGYWKRLLAMATVHRVRLDHDNTVGAFLMGFFLPCYWFPSVASTVSLTPSALSSLTMRKPHVLNAHLSQRRNLISVGGPGPSARNVTRMVSGNGSSGGVGLVSPGMG